MKHSLLPLVCAILTAFLQPSLADATEMPSHADATEMSNAGNAVTGITSNIDVEVLGDVNKDGYLDLADIAAIMAYISGNGAGEGGTTLANVDVNGDGRADVADIVTLFNYLAGKFGCETWLGIRLLLSDGTSHYFLLEDEPKIEFSDDVLIFTTNKTDTVHVDLSENQAKFFFVNFNAEARKILENCPPLFLLSGTTLEAIGLEPNTSFSVYGEENEVVAKVLVGSNGYAKLPVAKSGSYTVKTPVSTFTIKR